VLGMISGPEPIALEACVAVSCLVEHDAQALLDMQVPSVA